MEADDTIKSAGENILTAIGSTTAEYRPKVGNPVTCKAHVDRDTDLVPGNIEFQVRFPVINVEALLHELGQTPGAGDEFTIDSTVYRVQAPADTDGYWATCVVQEVIDDGL